MPKRRDDDKLYNGPRDCSIPMIKVDWWRKERGQSGSGKIKKTSKPPNFSHDDPYVWRSDEEEEKEKPSTSKKVEEVKEEELDVLEFIRRMELRDYYWREPEVKLKFGTSEEQYKDCLVTTPPGTAESWSPLEMPKEPALLMNLGNPRDDDGKSSHPTAMLKRHTPYNVRLEKIVNPSNFFMELILDSPKDKCGCETRDECLQKFYNDPVKAENYKMKTFEPLKGQMYAILDKDFGKWMRVRVQNYYCPNLTVNIVYLDTLTTNSEIKFDQLHELHPRYGYWPRCPINGGLKDIVPEEQINGNDPEADWCEEAVEYFKEITKDKIFLAYFFDIQLEMWDNITHFSNDDRFAKANVILFENMDEKSPQIPVNALMVDAGYALPFNTMTDCLDKMNLCYGVRP